jgi:hypothetical protein
MKKSQILWRFVLPVLQILLWGISYDLYSYFVFHYFNSKPRGVGWGISLDSYFYVYISLVLLLNVLVNLTTQFHFLFFLIGTFLFALVASQTFSVYPYRTSFIVISAAFCLSMSLIKRKSDREGVPN